MESISLSANTVEERCKRTTVGSAEKFSSDRKKAESLLQSILDMIAQILVLMSTEKNADED